MDTPIAPGTVSPTRAELIRAALSAMIGNWFELFDFIIYGYFSAQIGAAMFPAADPLTTSLASFASFGVGFVMRPIGSIVLGSMGDRFGRKSTLVFTMLLMAASTGATGLIPSYQSIGIAAPILLVICRLLQGFATGGEWGGATTFLVEYAPPHRRGLFGAFQQISGNVAVMSAVGIALLLNVVLSPLDLASWGWRLPFLFGFLVAPLGFYLRSRVSETPQFRAEHGNVPSYPLREALTINRRAVMTIAGVAIIWTVAGYCFGPFLITFATLMLKIDPSWAYAAMLTGAGLNVTVSALAGHLSDRVGRRPFLIASASGFLLLAIPMFAMMAIWKSGPSVVLTGACAGVLSGLFAGVAPTFFCELLPTRVRYTALSVGYSTAVMIFGGFTPMIAVLLIKSTGSLVAPGFYVTGCAAISLAVILTLRQRASHGA